MLRRYKPCAIEVQCAGAWCHCAPAASRGKPAARQAFRLPLTPPSPRGAGDTPSERRAALSLATKVWGTVSGSAAESRKKLKVHTKGPQRSFLYGHFSFVSGFIHTKSFFSGFMYGQKHLFKLRRVLFCPKCPYKTCQRSVFVWIFVCKATVPPRIIIPIVSMQST